MSIRSRLENDRNKKGERGGGKRKGKENRCVLKTYPIRDR